MCGTYSRPSMKAAIIIYILKKYAIHLFIIDSSVHLTMLLYVRIMIELQMGVTHEFITINPFLSC